MTRREKKLQSMLNYFEIEMDGTRDEKMTKQESDDFIDRFNKNYDNYMIEEIMKKIRGGSPMNEDEDDANDPFLDSLKGVTDDKSDKTNKQNPFFDYLKPPFDFGSKLPFGINPEIEKFLDWMTNLLYSADHKVTISDEGNITHIKLQKLRSKRGGKKK